MRGKVLGGEDGVRGVRGGKQREEGGKVGSMSR